MYKPILTSFPKIWYCLFLNFWMRFVNDDIKFVFKMWTSVWPHLVPMAALARTCLVRLSVSVLRAGRDKHVNKVTSYQHDFTFLLFFNGSSTKIKIVILIYIWFSRCGRMFEFAMSKWRSLSECSGNLLLYLQCRMEWCSLWKWLEHLEIWIKLLQRINTN